MTIVICPGIHPPEMTTQFVQGIKSKVRQNCLVLPTEEYLPYSAIAILEWLEQQNLVKTETLAWIGFSAGVVGSFGAAWGWQLRGGKVSCLIAIDGWGMPLVANFPIYRVSHDFFTHWSSGILGAGEQGFYAEPEVTHQEIWRSPDTCQGWQIISRGLRTRVLLSDYLGDLLDQEEIN
ncbi:MAG: hypothetical protein AAF652_11160 [Cyanobacteria bacterium P01_C01_bin.72]